MPAFVILSEAKNLMSSCTYYVEILRLTPQNDVVGQPHEAFWGTKLTSQIFLLLYRHSIHQKKLQ